MESGIRSDMSEIPQKRDRPTLKSTKVLTTHRFSFVGGFKTLQSLIHNSITNSKIQPTNTVRWSISIKDNTRIYVHIYIYIHMYIYTPIYICIIYIYIYIIHIVMVFSTELSPSQTLDLRANFTRRSWSGWVRRPAPGLGRLFFGRGDVCFTCFLL